MEAEAAPQSSGPAASTAATIAAFFNHLLRGNPWALERLRPHAGKTVLLRAIPFEWRFTLAENGEVLPESTATEPDLRILATVPLWLRIFAMHEPDLNLAEISGDSTLTDDLAYLVRYLVWDLEEDLSQVFGDVAAHRMTEGGRKLLGWPGSALFGLAGALAEYWVEERPLLARPEEVGRYLREVVLLAVEVDTLETRIERLER